MATNDTLTQYFFPESCFLIVLVKNAAFGRYYLNIKEVIENRNCRGQVNRIQDGT